MNSTTMTAWTVPLATLAEAHAIAAPAFGAGK
jgi:hypothetical protein